MSLTFDVNGRLGFVLLVSNDDPRVLKFVCSALADMGVQGAPLRFIEIFKVLTN